MKHFVIFALFCLLSSAHLNAYGEAPPGQIAISPSMFELSIGNKPVNESIRLHNLKKEPVKVRVEVCNWTFDDQNKVRIIPGNAQSLDQWMLINPLSFTVEPGKSGVVRFSIRPRSRPEPGEHRAMIYLTEEAVGEPVAGSVRVLFRYGMAIYGQCGTVDRSAELAGLTFNRSNSILKADISNTGNIHTRLTGEYTMWKAGTFPGFKAMADYLNKTKSDKTPDGLLASGTLHSVSVLPGQRRSIAERLDLPEIQGGYVIAFSGKLGERTIEKLF